jgi:hypothetical protein
MAAQRIPKTYLKRDGKRARLYRPGKERGAYLELHRCTECRELFWAAKSNALTCSDNCRKKRSRRIQHELRQIEAGQLSMPIPA